MRTEDNEKRWPARQTNQDRREIALAELMHELNDLFEKHDAGFMELDHNIASDDSYAIKLGYGGRFELDEFGRDYAMLKWKVGD